MKNRVARWLWHLPERWGDHGWRVLQVSFWVTGRGVQKNFNGSYGFTQHRGAR